MRLIFAPHRRQRSPSLSYTEKRDDPSRYREPDARSITRTIADRSLTSSRSSSDRAGVAGEMRAIQSDSAA